MTSKNQVKIYGKSYTVKDESTDIPLPRIADYVDSKMKELSGNRKMAPLDAAILAALNITQELMESQNEMIQGAKDKEKLFKEIDQRVGKMVGTLAREIDR